MKLLPYFLLFCVISFAQNKPEGNFEHKYFAEKNSESYNYGFGHTYKLEINKDDSFILTTDKVGGCIIADLEKITGLCKYKKDTLILVTPLSEKYIKKTSDLLLSPHKFCISIRNFCPVYVQSCMDNLSFYFIDNEMNSKKVKPSDIKINSNKNEIFLTFDIPENSLYFTKKELSEYNNVTLNIADILGKEFTLSDDYQKLENVPNSQLMQAFTVIYFDYTLDKYIVNKKKTVLKAVKKYQSYDGISVRAVYRKI